MWILASLCSARAMTNLSEGYPVIFCLVFNSYFSGKDELLEDVSYCSPAPKPSGFSEVKMNVGNEFLNRSMPGDVRRYTLL